MERFAIIGFGCAGYHGLAAIRKAGCDAAIDIYSDTALPPYNPMLTTYYTAGRLPFEGMFPFGTMEEIAVRYKANFITHTKVKAVHAREKTVETGNGHKEPYDRILVATGATAFVPGSFAGLKGAFCMRTVEDAVRLHDALESGDYKDAVVVGASMVGIKVAELLHKKGIHVTLADMASHIFALAAYPQVSEIIEDRIRAMGMDTAFGQAITSAEEHLDGQGNVTGYTLHLEDGSCLETEMLILNIGTRACTGILDPDEIAIGRGIVVDERMHTSARDIFAAGDCCQGNNMQSGQTQIIGLWANAGVQGRVAGRNMAGVADETDGKPVGFNILDNHDISGILKAHLIKLLRGEPCRFTPEQRGQLVRYGLEQSFMDYLEASI